VTLRFATGATAQIVVTTPVNTGAVLIQATGSEDHLAQLVAFATHRGYTLAGAALWHGSQFVPTPDEATLYRALGLAEIPPELREGLGEIEAAAGDRLPRLVEARDLKGFLHCHSNYSDGTTSIEELARACQAAGYEYLGLTDHSQSAAYAGGLTAEDLSRQSDEVDDINRRLGGLRVLKGVEADILADGSLDYDDAVLARLDFVIGSIHTRFNMSESQMTERMLRAMESPHLAIIGHPTGRLLLSRDPYPIDLEAVFRTAAQRGVAIEINADPHRLDLDWRLVRKARAMGVPISLGADAHNVAGMANVEVGIGMARKAWLTRDDLLNARPMDGFLEHVARRRAG
jgi:DNA polymerase (family 10)